MRLERTLWWIALVFACSALGFVGISFVRVLALTARGAMDSDMLPYFAVGRGILNGWTPYRDVFEAKPPGILLLSSLSLLLSGDQRFFSILGCVGFMLFPALMGWMVWSESRTHGWSPIQRVSWTMVSLVAGMLLALYLENRSFIMQTEFFGSLLLSVYAVLVLRWREHVTLRRMLLLALCVGGAIGLKEPFAIPALAIALLMVRSSREFLFVFVLPLLIAAAGGMLFLLATGWLEPYARWYLPAMRFRTVSPDPHEPFWARGLSIRYIVADFTKYYTTPMQGYLLAGVWMTLPLAGRQERRWLPILAVLLGGAILIALIHYTYFAVVAFSDLAHGVPLRPAVVPAILRRLGLACALFLPVAWIQWRSGYLLRTALCCVALYCASLAIGISVYATNHFAFAVAVYFAAILLVLVAAARRALHPAVACVLGVLTLATAFTYRPDQKHLTVLRDSLARTASAKAPMAGRLDGLLNACKYDRYISDGVIPDFGFTRHTPVGPLFMWGFFSYIPEDNILKKETLARLREGNAPLIVHPGNEQEEPFRSVLPRLTEKPPPCAAAWLPIPGYRVYFPLTGTE